MREVYVAGVGMTPFGKHRERTIEQLGREAVLAALDDAQVDRTQIDEIFCGSSYGGPLVGQRVVRDVGVAGPPITNVENACSSSASALREGVTAVRAGRADVVLVIGVEKLTRFGGGTLPLEDTDFEVKQGMVMPALYAMRAQRYLAEHGATAEDLARVSVKAHRQAAASDYAYLKEPIAVEDVLSSRMIAEPLTLFMCCPTSDGAAAVVLTSSTNGAGRPGVRVAASVLRSGTYKTGFRDLAFSELTQRTSRIAYDEAGIEADNVDVTELHDAFSIAELMYYEALGFCGPGEGKDLLGAGETESTGSFPVNTGGGLLCRGHPVGATGTAQVCEVTWQLRGEGGDRQVQDPRFALTHCTGGGISGLDHGACAIHIFEALA